MQCPQRDARNFPSAYTVRHAIANTLAVLPSVNGSVTQRNYKNPSAPVHVVIGASGDNEGLTSDFVQPQPDWSAVRAAVLGFARMRFFNASTMHFEWVAAETGEVFDNFTLTKHNPSARPKAVNHFTASA